jgi:uncharacterized ion transporter superfamily protein YfcC
VATSVEDVTSTEPERRRRAPDTYVIIFFVVIAAALLTFFVTPGSFEVEDVTFDAGGGEEDTRTVLVPDSFTSEDAPDPVPLFAEGGDAGLLNYVFEGLVSGDKFGAAVGIVAFILIIGGSFGIVMRTRAVEGGILAMIRRTQGREAVLIPAMFVLFSLGGAVFGMGEEAIAFAMILVPLVVAMGYDSLTGILITYVATQVGFATSWMNPFGVAIAQGLAGVPVLSGAPFRIVMWIGFTALGTAFTMWWARRVKRDPERSPAYASDAYWREDVRTAGEELEEYPFTWKHGLVLVTILVAVVWIVWGVVTRAYFIPEIAAQFFTMGLVAGVIGAAFRLGGMGVNDIAEGFKDGAKDILSAALIVGMAKGIILVLGGDDPAEPSTLNTVLHTLGGPISELPGALAAWSMFAFQSVFNFFVTSGSGQAALTMPLLGPLSDLVEVPRQVTVLAFQLGDGFTNLIVPTSAALMGTLGVARVDWVVWAKFIVGFVGVLFVVASVVVIGAELAGFS